MITLSNNKNVTTYTGIFFFFVITHVTSAGILYIHIADSWYSKPSLTKDWEIAEQDVEFTGI